MLDKETWEELCRENARNLTHEIDRLQSDNTDPLGFWHRYSDFWKHARRISEMLKTVKPLFQEDREGLCAVFSVACEATRTAQAREREARQSDSREKRDLVMSKIREAYFQAKEAADPTAFSQADALLSEALTWTLQGGPHMSLDADLICTVLLENRDKWDSLAERGGFELSVPMFNKTTSCKFKINFSPLLKFRFRWIS